jgi:hypothetical protein
MLQKVKKFLSSFKKNRPPGEIAKIRALRQADLSEDLAMSLSLAIKLGLRVYIRVDVGDRSHGISVQGKDDTTLRYLHDLAVESRRVSLIEAIEACIPDPGADQPMGHDDVNVLERARNGLK